MKQRFEVYVCTAAERGYALEAWRILDPKVRHRSFVWRRHSWGSAYAAAAVLCSLNSVYGQS